MEMIRLAIAGTGGMANFHAKHFSSIRGVKLVACCDVLKERAAEFATKHDVPQHFASVESMLDSCQVDAVSVATSDGSHAPVSLAAIARGKHVLCEKPLAPTYPEAIKMAEAAQSAGVINMVNFSYRDSAAIQAMAAVTAKGDLGRILHVQGSYLQGWLASAYWGNWRTNSAWLWRLSSSHGSLGVLGDIGVHIVDFTSYPVGGIASVHCLLKTFDKAPDNRVGEYRLDANDTALLTVEFEGGAAGTIATTRWATGHANSVTLAIYGENGALRVDLDKSWSEYERCRIGRDGKHGAWERVVAKPTPNIYKRFVKSIRTGRNDAPDFARGAEVQKVLDACVYSNRRARPVVLSDFQPKTGRRKRLA